MGAERCMRGVMGAMGNEILSEGLTKMKGT